MSETRKLPPVAIDGPPDGVSDFPKDQAAWFAKGEVLRAELAPHLEAVGAGAVQAGWNGWDVARVMMSEVLLAMVGVFGREAVAGMLLSAVDGLTGRPFTPRGLDGQPETRQ